MLNIIIYFLFFIIKLFRVFLLFTISTIYHIEYIRYANTNGIAIILYFIDFKISPCNKQTIALVKPQPGHGIPNRLYIKQTLLPE